MYRAQITILKNPTLDRYYFRLFWSYLIFLCIWVHVARSG